MVEIIGTIKKGVSKNNNKEYVFIEIPICGNYKKVVFLDKAEIELIKMAFNLD